MLDVQALNKLAKEWYETVPDEMKNKVIVGNFSIKPMTFTPKQILDKINTAGKKTKSRKAFLKETGLCGEFLETLEKISKLKAKQNKKRGKKS